MTIIKDEMMLREGHSHMGNFLIVSKADRLQEYKQIADKYQLGFELNDFYAPSVLENPDRQQELIEQYQLAGLPAGSTMHGAFLDVVLFSEDPEIRRIARLRMSQSMEIAKKLGVKGVVFHTNSNPALSSAYYDRRVAEMVSEYTAQLLEAYPGIDIYLENMFDANPVLLARIARNLESYPGFGICLDYAHAAISGTPIAVWVDSLAKYIKHLHINDNDLRRDLHLAVGDGNINWNHFIRYYWQNFYPCTTLIETALPEQQIRSLQYLKKLRLFTYNSSREQKTDGGNPMKTNKTSHAEDLLEKIFYYMNQLIEEKDFSATILLLTELGRTLVNADRASFWYWDTRNKQYWTIAALGSDRITVPENSGIIGASISNNETILLNDPQNDPRFDDATSKLTNYPVQSILCMPVTDSKGRVIGAYQALNKVSEDGNAGQFDEQDQKHLALAAVYCGKALESHILYTESHMDALTGLQNRRGFFDYCWEHFEQDEITEQQTALSLIMCDIDFFKKVNDTYGHNAGDAVLVHVADTLQSTLPPKAQAVRWGGEEFVLLLEEMNVEQAAEHAEKLRQHIEQSVCSFDGQDIHITMSFGVKQWEHEKTAAVNIGFVDERLYQAKTSGRNRVISK